ncbi:hypothetical protein [Cellulomonas aerilata]|uniref:hypothetical protein n=1 Tax=Cellulomonas aerilata TaxID=515326 RepID=UPI001C99700E|nr:hypothetical protein [Cellulomonas aerilata]
MSPTVAAPTAATHPPASPDARRAGVLLGAVRDNARWCALVSASHGIAGRADADAWTARRRTPPGYPDAVTLRPRLAPGSVLSRIDTEAPGCSVKDSFADLDLAPSGFRELFAATWIGHPGTSHRAPAPGRLRWARVTDAATLSAWQDARGDTAHPLLPALLAEPEVTVLAARDGTGDGGDVVAGAILTTGVPGVVGVSNVFTAGATAGEAWAGPLGWAADRHAGRPLVGYERGDDLAAALAGGFAALGPLRVWMATA